MWLGFFSRGDTIAISTDATEHRKIVELTKPGRLRLYNASGNVVHTDRAAVRPSAGLTRNVFYYLLSIDLSPGYYLGVIDYTANNKNYLKWFRFRVIPTDNSRGPILSHFFVSRAFGTTVLRKCNNNTRVSGREIKVSGD